MDNNYFLSTCKKKKKQTHNKNKNSKTTLEDCEADLRDFSSISIY